MGVQLPVRPKHLCSAFTKMDRKALNDKRAREPKLPCTQ